MSRPPARDVLGMPKASPGALKTGLHIPRRIDPLDAMLQAAENSAQSAEEARRLLAAVPATDPIAPDRRRWAALTEATESKVARMARATPGLTDVDGALNAGRNAARAREAAREEAAGG